MTQASEEQIAALREQVRGAGEAVAHLRHRLEHTWWSWFFFSLTRPVAVAYRLARLGQLRRRLTALTPSERAAVLLPLRQEVGDTRKIVRPLLRQLSIPTELTPADAPTGRGDEPTP
jgi:hypothetical protein